MFKVVRFTSNVYNTSGRVVLKYTNTSGLSLKQGMGNPGIGESGNPGIGESGNLGIGESGNRGIRESGNPGIGESGNEIMKIYSLLTPVKHMIFQRQV